MMRASAATSEVDGYMPFDEALSLNRLVEQRAAEHIAAFTGTVAEVVKAGAAYDVRDGREATWEIKNEAFRNHDAARWDKRWTGNVFFEISQGRDDHPSGIVISTAWFYFAHLGQQGDAERWILAPMATIQEHVRNLLNKGAQTMLCGDNNNKGYKCPANSSLFRQLEFPLRVGETLSDMLCRLGQRRG